MRVKPFPVAISHTKHYRNLFYKYIYIWPYNMFVQKAKNACIHTGVCVCVRRLKKQQRTLHEINTEVPEVILNYPGHSYRGVCTTSIVSTSHKPNALVMSPSVVKYRGGLCLYICCVCNYSLCCFAADIVLRPQRFIMYIYAYQMEHYQRHLWMICCVNLPRSSWISRAFPV